MFKHLTVFQTAYTMAVHAGARQALIAQNVANADTPGYRTRDLPAFAQLYEARRQGTGPFRRDEPGASLSAFDVSRLQPIIEDDMDPNRNGVSLEDEMVRAAEVKRDHDRALSIYRSAVTVLRMSLGNS